MWPESSPETYPDDPEALQAALKAVLADRDRYAGQMTQIRASMREVAVYEDLVDTSPTVMLVAELVRDHEELEARIDAAVMLCSEHTDDPVVMEVARLLQGGPRTPDTIEGLLDP
jgi:hypothetical protein